MHTFLDIAGTSVTGQEQPTPTGTIGESRIYNLACGFGGMRYVYHVEKSKNLSSHSG